jgi:uncharacterized membrane protein YdbT with pleckstrin-like domain
VTSPDERDAAAGTSTDEPAPRRRSAPAAALRAFARQVRLVVTAAAIVLALAFGIPWLISLVW